MRFRSNSTRLPRALPWLIAALALLFALLAPRASLGQDTPALPFSVGERLTYRIKVGKMGNVGRGSMWIEGPVDVRGTDAVLLRFDFEAGIGPVRAVDRTKSWLDLRWMRSLRFWKHERHPLSRHDESVELYPAERRYEEAGGERGESPTDSPLDELSFMYFLRTIPLEKDTTYSFNRHFSAERNPTTLRVVGTERLETAAGTFETIVVEMRVRDPRRYRGEGVIRINLTDDHCRLPVRIESAMPVVGRAIMTLEHHTHGEAPCAAR